jgi:hypothetical protein
MADGEKVQVVEEDWDQVQGVAEVWAEAEI